MALSWKDIEGDSKEKYQLYLQSREWSEKREAVRERAMHLCERCHVNPMDACHHLTYARKYDEDLDDLQAICNGCHEFTHGKSDKDPRLVVHERPITKTGCINCPVWSDPILDMNLWHQEEYTLSTVVVCINGHCLSLEIGLFDNGPLSGRFIFEGHHSDWSRKQRAGSEA